MAARWSASWLAIVMFFYAKHSYVTGYGFTSDMNGYRQEGVAYMDMTIKNGVRSSTSRSYLRPVRDFVRNNEIK